MVKKLLSGRKDTSNNEGIDLMNADGETALQMAIRQKNLEIILILIQYDAGIQYPYTLFHIIS